MFRPVTTFYNPYSSMLVLANKFKVCETTVDMVNS